MTQARKSPLYFFIETQLKSKSLFHLGGILMLAEIRSIIEKSINDCCMAKVKTRNVFVKEVQQMLHTYSLPKDKVKLQFILDKLIIPRLTCCEEN